MVGLLIAGCVSAAVVLYGADRAVKARARARRRREMSDRLAAATARADEQAEQRQAAARAGAALTSVMPAINRPPLTGPRAGTDRDEGVIRPPDPRDPGAAEVAGSAHPSRPMIR